MESSRLILSRIRAAYLAIAAAVAAVVAARGPRAGVRAGPRGPAPADQGGPDRHAAERADLLHPQERRAGRPRVSPACRQGRIDRRGRRPARARARARAHGVQRIGALSSGELVKYLESIGAQFGPHVNAYTSFDETVYMLERADRSRRRADARAGGAERLRRRHHARRRGDRQGARRGHRGMARPAGGERAHAGAAAAGGCSAARATSIACRSARRRASRASPPSGCASSTATTTVPIGWP